MAAAPTEVAAVLADPTRFNIYEALARSRPRSYTAQEIARQFYLHPNVARTHLGRLEEVGLVESFLEKTGRGGRPARRYRAVDRAVTLQFPRRDWLPFSRLLVRTLEELGPAAVEAARRHAYEEGLALGRRLASRLAHGPDGSPAAADNGQGGSAERLPVERLQALLQQHAAAQSLSARPDGGLTLRFTTCVLREVAQDYPQTACSLHRAYLHGLMEGLIGPAQMVFENSMLFDEHATCDWTVYPASAAAAPATEPA